MCLPGEYLFRWRPASLLSIVITALAAPAVQAESLDFTAEHILEIPMDFRFSALPAPPVDMANPERRVSVGYGDVSGEQMRNRIPMLGLSGYFPAASQSGWLVGGFLDAFSFSGGGGDSIVHPTFGRPPGSPERFNVSVGSVSGSGWHAGLSGAWALATQAGNRFEFGLAYSRLHVSRYRVDFTPREPGLGFAGFVDYAANYDAWTPFTSWHGTVHTFGTGWSGSPSAVLAWPLPRTGFSGRLVGPGFDISGDTDAAGNGRHIPDPYFGLDYTIEHRASGLRINLGGALYSWFIEPLGHSSIDHALHISLSLPF